MNLAWLMVGCGSPEIQPQGEASPRAQLKQMYKALLEGNEDAFLARFALENSKEEQVVREAYFELQATMAFHRRFLEVYGEDAWKEFQEASDDEAKGKEIVKRIDLYVPSKSEYERLDEIALQESGSTYTCRLFDESVKMVLVQSEGVWLLDASALIPDTISDVESWIQNIKVMLSVVEEYTEMMESLNLTPRQLNEQMGIALFDRLRKQ